MKDSIIKKILLIVCIAGYIVVSFFTDYVRTTSYAAVDTAYIYREDFIFAIIGGILALISGYCLSKEKVISKIIKIMALFAIGFSIIMLIVM